MTTPVCIADDKLQRRLRKGAESEEMRLEEVEENEILKRKFWKFEKMSFSEDGIEKILTSGDE